MVYSYTKSVNPEEPLENILEVPRFRFVKAAIAIEQVPNGSKAGRVFLLEENIEAAGDGKFRKYMNNEPWNFYTFDNAEDSTRAEFLRFTQHVQMWKTGKLAFVSDYQGTFSPEHNWVLLLITSLGGNSLLTDCQIMTHPYVMILLFLTQSQDSWLIIFSSDLGPVFADGNLPRGFSGLLEHHDCNNRYCKFFNPLPLVDVQQSPVV
jgi:hypothetical protein